MSQIPAGVGRYVQALADERSDEALLADYLTRRDEAAFALLVRRHQQTVWAACARFLPDPDDREDAFQATFLALARTGHLLADRGGLGGWLYRVAGRVARKARVAAARRKRREALAAGVPEEEAPASSPPDADLLAVVGEELDRLPERYRLAVLACDFDGLGRAEAARRLGCGAGTLSARLHRGRRRLAALLRARGITAPVAALAALAGRTAPAPAALARQTAERIAGPPATAALARAADLVSLTTTEMVMRIVKRATAAAALVALVAVGGFVSPGGATPRAPLAPQAGPGDRATPPPATAVNHLRNRKVHRELNCTADQRVAIADHFDDQFEAAANAPPLLPQPVPPGLDKEALKEFLESAARERTKADEDGSRAMAAKVLTPAQLARLVELDRQVRGAEALLDPPVAAALKLTDGQKGDVVAALTKAAQGRGNAQPDALVTGLEGVARYWHLDPQQRKAAIADAEKCLTDAQRAVWKKMVGVPAKTFDPHTVGGRGGSITSGVQFRGS